MRRGSARRGQRTRRGGDVVGTVALARPARASRGETRSRVAAHGVVRVQSQQLPIFAKVLLLRLLKDIPTEMIHEYLRDALTNRLDLS
jgi:hypothetical protein